VWRRATRKVILYKSNFSLKKKERQGGSEGQFETAWFNEKDTRLMQREKGKG